MNNSTKKAIGRILEIHNPNRDVREGTVVVSWVENDLATAVVELDAEIRALRDGPTSKTTIQPGAVEAGSVIQIDPEAGAGIFSGCFVVVTEVKSWGVVGYAVAPGNIIRGLAYGRFTPGSWRVIGQAVWDMEPPVEEMR